MKFETETQLFIVGTYTMVEPVSPWTNPLINGLRSDDNVLLRVTEIRRFGRSGELRNKRRRGHESG
jgi:hypothetical protein